ncbi:MAG: DinB family protein [candidate division Zixibacteria bacterium]|nr:DinB family protein [candidate division Zixibacteria bacterium]MCI0596631.1 DinB family protein [candidate division Zixibacteria bacterium]
MLSAREIDEQLSVLQETGRKISECFSSFGPRMDFKPSPEKWSARQVLHHLTDSEIVLAYRLRTILSEKQPILKAFDQNDWSATLAPEREELAFMKGAFEANRNLTIRLLKKIPAALWEKKGVHEEAGEMRTYDLVARNTTHCLKHLEQLGKLAELSKAVK